MFQGILKKIMNQTDEILKQLEPLLAQVNMQNLSRVIENKANQNGSSQSNGGSEEGAPGTNDQIGRLIQAEEDRQKLDALVNSSSSNTTGATSPKMESRATSVGPTVNTKPTVVVKPAVTNTNKAAQYSPFTAAVTPEVVAQYTKQFGVPDVNVTKALLTAAKNTGTDANLMFKFARAESEFDPKAKATGSSAKGLFQFLDKTWNYVMDSLGGKDKFGLKGNKHDPYENAVAGALYLSQIKKEMAGARKSGEFSPGELYMGHFAGPGTAAKAIKYIDAGKGNAPATEVFDRSQVKANPKIFYDNNGKLRTVSEVLQKLSSRVA